MKLLKWLLTVLLLMGVALMGGLLLPGNSHLQRSVVIERPPAEVFAALNSFQRFTEWSPWSDLDRDAIYTYSGPLTGVGAKMAWTGNSSIGSGSQQIIKSTPDRSIVNALDVGGSQATAGYLLVAESSGTRVTWSMDSAHGYNPVKRWFGALLLDRVVGKDYEKGLAKLKSVLESGPRR
ncbi:MAG: SRPBCC family protein [Pseudoxanthomonas sp.]